MTSLHMKIILSALVKEHIRYKMETNWKESFSFLNLWIFCAQPSNEICILFFLKLPSEAGVNQPINNESARHIRECVVNLSEHKFTMVVSGLARLIKEPTFLVS